MIFAATIVAALVLAQPRADPGKCEDAPDVQFRWDWCAPNQQSGSAIKQVCFGDVIYTDMVFRAVQLQNGVGASATFDCLFSAGDWEDTALPDCERGIKRIYGPVYGENRELPLLECLTDGIVTGIRGAGLGGAPFAASRL